MTISQKIIAMTLISILVGISGCAKIVNVRAAPDANNPLCAPMMLSLPDSMAGEKRYETNSQATASWGNPTKVVLRCGITVSEEPTAFPCTEVNGVDWLIIQESDRRWQFISYGRSPVVEVTIDSLQISGTSILADLSGPVGGIPVYKICPTV